MNWWPFQRSAQTFKTIDDIVPPRYTFTGQDDALRLKTKQRRKAAEDIRSRARNVESGVPVQDLLRRVK